VTVVHDALFFASDDELIGGTQDLISGGIVAGDLVLVHGDEHELGVLRDAWDDDPRITFLTTGSLYEGAMATIGEYQRMLAQETAAGRTIRTTGIVPFRDGDRRSNLDWMRYEALIERAFAPYDFIGLCRYDTRTTDSWVLDHARETHERIVTAGDVLAGGGQRERLLAELAAGGADPLEDEPACYDAVLLGADDLRALRRALADAPQALVVAANEIASNALEHGAPPVTVRIHRGAEGWLCEIADHGPGIADPYAGVDSPLASSAGTRGRGLWLARQLTDHVSIGSGPGGGAVVRLVVRA
jgi:anti-sigma regulatory factor (Ser/Thr protein kinase)